MQNNKYERATVYNSMYVFLQWCKWCPVVQNIVNLTLKHKKQNSRIANSVDPDEVGQYVPYIVDEPCWLYSL